MGSPPMLVFLSHTSELSTYPRSQSFVAVALEVIARAGHACLEMAYFTADDRPPSAVCRAGVAKADLYVAIVGFDYGTPVRDAPDLSYTQMEFEEAGELGKPRLVFILSPEAEVPAVASNAEYAERQRAFRASLNEQGITTATFTTPAQLSVSLLLALGQQSRPVTSTRAAWRLPPRNPEFSGRAELLSTLRESMRSGGRSVVQALGGMGGVGKSTLAVEYAYRHAADYDIVWWVPAEDLSAVPRGLAELAGVLHLGDPGGPVEAAVDRLSAELGRTGRWLLIFDNADDPAGLAPLIPSGPGHVLITSRRADWAGLAVPVAMEVFTPAESTQLLAEALPELPARDAQQLATALGYLPLALVQAANYMGETGLAVDVYLRMLEEQTGEVLARGVQASSSPALSASLDLACNRLRDEDRVDALAFVKVLAEFAPEPVPLDVLDADVDGLPAALARSLGNPLLRADLVAQVRRRALAEHSPNGVAMHRLVQAVVRERHERGVDAGYGSPPTVALGLLEHALAGLDPWWNAASWTTWRALLPHVLFVTGRPRYAVENTEAVRACALTASAASFIRAAGDPQTALPLLERVHAVQARHRGVEHPDALVAEINLAACLSGCGRGPEGRRRAESAYSMLQSTAGPDHPRTLFAAQIVAFGFRAAGELERARDLDADTLHRRRRVLGPDDRYTLRSANNLAVGLRALGEFTAARDLMEDNYERRRRVMGEDHPDTLHSAHLLAYEYRRVGLNERARIIDEEVLTRRRMILGEDHPDTLRSAASLAYDLYRAGRYTVAAELDRKNLADRTRRLGAEHPDTVRSTEQLARDLRALGDRAPAADLTAAVVASRRRRLGADHQDTLVAGSELLSDLVALGREMDAAALLRELPELRPARS